MAGVLLGLQAERVVLEFTHVPDAELVDVRSVIGHVYGCYSAAPDVAMSIWRTKERGPGIGASRHAALAAAVRFIIGGFAAADSCNESEIAYRWSGVAIPSDTDFRSISHIITGVLGPKHVDPESSAQFATAVDEEFARTLDALELARPAVDRVAKELRRKGELEWEDVQALVGHPPAAAMERIREPARWLRLADERRQRRHYAKPPRHPRSQS